MESQSSSFESISPPAENNSTPEPQNETVAAKSHTTAAASSSMVPPFSSMTPPPSSQPPNPRGGGGFVRRSITPNPDGFAKPSQEQIQTATTEVLREMLHASLKNNTEIEGQLSLARTEAAHTKLQNHMLVIETQVALQRYEVENEMVRTDVGMLRKHLHGGEYFNYVQQLKASVTSYEEALTKTNIRLEKAKRVIALRDDELVEAKEKISMLQTRIRDNREHINKWRTSISQDLLNSPNTPQQLYRGTPRTPGTGRSTHQFPREHMQEERFNALILAGSLLNQENNSAPSTPIVGRRPEPKYMSKHIRGAQSLSSLQASPVINRPRATSTLLPSAQFPGEVDGRVVNAMGRTPLRDAPRPKSRDSTISASSFRAGEDSFRQESEEIDESQASQSATAMLRADPRQSFEVAESRTHTPAPAEVHLQPIQSKMFPSVLKKRKLAGDDDVHESSPKRHRVPDPVGLGISA